MSSEFIKKVNKIIENEHGIAVSLDNILLDAQIDSFGWCVFWLELNKIYPDVFTQEFINELDYTKATFKDLAQKVK